MWTVIEDELMQRKGKVANSILQCQRNRSGRVRKEPFGHFGRIQKPSKLILEEEAFTGRKESFEHSGPLSRDSTGNGPGHNYPEGKGEARRVSNFNSVRK